MPDVMSWRARLPSVEDIPNPVHDGDTLWLTSDQGDYYRKVRDLRLQNVYAPELSQEGGDDCRLFVVAWLARWNVGSWPFWVDTIRTSKYTDVRTFNRYVAQVWNRDRTANLNVEVEAYARDHGYPEGD